MVMNNDDKSSNLERKQGYMIPVRLLGGFAITFLLGYAAHGLMQNFLAANTLSFSTPELINFVLSVLLSGASIFLAITAIALGRFSEQAIIQRSDESIRLQNEVFQKTTDALSRIESSTGVTEKRIEDIISGRVGDLSQKIVRIATEKQETQGSLKPQDIEEMIKRTLYQSLREEGVFRTRITRDEESQLRNEEERIRQQQREEYKTRSASFMKVLSKREDLKVVRVSRGNLESTGESLFDGIFLRKDGGKIGVMDFGFHLGPELLARTIYPALRMLHEGVVAYIFVVLYGPSEPHEKLFAETLSIASPELRKKISFVVCPLDKIEEVATKLTIPSS